MIKSNNTGQNKIGIDYTLFIFRAYFSSFILGSNKVAAFAIYLVVLGTEGPMLFFFTLQNPTSHYMAGMECEKWVECTEIPSCMALEQRNIPKLAYDLSII